MRILAWTERIPMETKLTEEGVVLAPVRDLTLEPGATANLIFKPSTMEGFCVVEHPSLWRRLLSRATAKGEGPQLEVGPVEVH